MRKTGFVESYFDAWNQHDANSVASHLAVHGTYHDIPEQQQTSGDELILNLKRFFSNNKHYYELLGDILEGDHSIAFQYRVSLADHVDIFCGAEFISLEGDAAIRITDYYAMPGNAPAISTRNFNARYVSRKKYAKSGLCTSQIGRYSHQLAILMKTEQTYLDPDLTLPKLAALLECPVNHLSQVINAGFDMSFFDYLNLHRIEHARRLLGQPNGQNQSILNIAFAAGFNSPSSFYAAFRKACGQTPAQYRHSAMRNYLP